RSHWSTSKTPSYTKSVSWQHHQLTIDNTDHSLTLFYNIFLLSKNGYKLYILQMSFLFHI
ncbi:hypothetical protein WI618_21090, partial [Salmonella enterica subsp. enterica serovar Corvallis]